MLWMDCVVKAKISNFIIMFPDFQDEPDENIVPSTVGASLDLTGYSSLQRIAMIYSAVPIYSLFLQASNFTVDFQLS